VLGVVGAVLLFAAPAHAISYAPVDAPGPVFTVPQSALDASLRCNDAIASARVAPVLFVAGTTVSPREDFEWNWERAMQHLGRPYCDVTVPGHSMADIQVAGEYIVNAIRTMYGRSGHKIAIIGHSQGGMSPRWALRFWPDTRAMVDDLIGLAPSNHGTIVAPALCAVGGCAPAIWQQRNTSPLIKAVNSGQETFAGISYTVIYSHTDEVVLPNADAKTGSSALRGGDGRVANIAIQDVCPLDISEHLGVGTYDHTAFALGLDALSYAGPAVVGRIDPGVCNDPVMPAIDRGSFLADFAQAADVLAHQLATYPHVPAEPALACYVTASCPTPPAAAKPVAQKKTTIVTNKKAAKKKTAAKKKHRAKRKPARKQHPR
jgi:hypothetical protein